MRKITETIVDAFISHKAKCIGNSSTDGKSLFLHGNLIAYHGTLNGAEGVFMTLAGWNTSTTRARLNGVLRVMGHNYRDTGCGALSFYTRKGEPFIGENTDHNTALALHSDSITFIAHPCTAKGMAAVSPAIIKERI